MQNLNGRKKTFQFSMQVSVTPTFVYFAIFCSLYYNEQIPNSERRQLFYKCFFQMLIYIIQMAKWMLRLIGIFWRNFVKRVAAIHIPRSRLRQQNSRNGGKLLGIDSSKCYRVASVFFFFLRVHHMNIFLKKEKKNERELFCQ